MAAGTTGYFQMCLVTIHLQLKPRFTLLKMLSIIDSEGVALLSGEQLCLYYTTELGKMYDQFLTRF